MTDDLVKQLRNSGWYLAKPAADHIEKLEAALRLYACDCKPDDGCGVEYYDGGANCGRTAQKALERKDD